MADEIAQAWTPVIVQEVWTKGWERALQWWPCHLCSWLPLLPSDYGILPCCSSRMPPYCHSPALSSSLSKPLSVTQPSSSLGDIHLRLGCTGLECRLYTRILLGLACHRPVAEFPADPPIPQRSLSVPAGPFPWVGFYGCGNLSSQLPLRSVDSIPFPLLFPLPFPFLHPTQFHKDFFLIPLGVRGHLLVGLWELLQCIVDVLCEERGTPCLPILSSWLSPWDTVLTAILIPFTFNSNTCISFESVSIHCFSLWLFYFSWYFIALLVAWLF